MITRNCVAVCLFAALAWHSSASGVVEAAGTNDHFANRRRAAAQAANQGQTRPWGGPTTGRNWWTPDSGRHYRVTVPPYAYPGYGYPGYFGVPGYYTPYYSPTPSVYYGPAYFPGRRIYIERRIELRR